MVRSILSRGGCGIHSAMEAEFELFGSKGVKISILTTKGNPWKTSMLNILPELNRVAS